LNTVNVLGYKVCDTDYRELLIDLKGVIKSKERVSIISLNPNKVMLAEKNQMIKDILMGTKYLIPDGTGILWASRREEKELKNRITGISLFEEICLNSFEIGAKIFLLGSTALVVEKTQKALKEKYPAIEISGYMDGYFEDNDKTLDLINSSGANLLAVAMGSPKQELWIQENAKQLENINIFIGLGGAFDVISGQMKRAPKWMIKLGLEWLYRIARQPIARIKNLVTIFRFCKVVLTRKK